MRHRWLPTLIGVAALAVVMALRIADPVPVTQVRNWVFDSYQRLEPRAYQPAGVRIVDIDETSLAAYGQWPWPRTVVASLVERLDQLGAAAIVFDMVFAEPDRTAPGRLLTAWQGHGLTQQVRSALQALPDPDSVLAEAIAATPTVTGFVPRTARETAQDRPGTTRAPRKPARPAGFAFSGDDPAALLPRFRAATTNLPPIDKAASGNGSFGIVSDPDNVVRRIPLAQTIDGTVYPSLAAEALRVAQGASTHIIKTSTGSGHSYFGGELGVTAMKIGRVVVPTTAEGRVLLYDTGPVAERSISAARVLGGPPDGTLRQQVKGHIVLIGTSAPGLRDIRATPLNPAAAGVTVHAQAIEQMILGAHLRRPDWANGAETLALLAVGGVLILLLPGLGAVWCAVLGAVAVGGGVAASWFAFSDARLLLDPVFPALAGLAVYLPMSSALFFQSERQKRFVRQAFSRYLSPALVERLAAQPDTLRLGGEERELTLMFSDIRGFTSVAETMTPEQLTSFMNQFLTPMTEEVLTHSGFIDKYMGDAIMAFWNAPVTVDDHPLEACRTALAMRRRLRELNAAWHAEFAQAGRDFPGVAIGIGLNTDVCCVGNLGSEQRFDYSALGDGVNLASRLEGQSKTYGVDVVLNETTVARCGDRIATLELDLIRVKGKQEPARIFTLVGDGSLWRDEAFAGFAEQHREMIAAYREQAWDRAEAAAEACLKALETSPDWLPDGLQLDRLYALYRTRIADLRADPPPADWDAVFEPGTK
jgi:adenylate cyclase